MASQPVFPQWPYRDRSAHLLGVGGSGMRALAEFLSDLNWSLTGDDLDWSRIGDWASSLGIEQCSGGASAVDLTIRSAAIPDAGKGPHSASGEFTYPEMLAELSKATPTIAVAGTHGKTTTAVLLSVAMGMTSRIVGGVARHDSRSGRFNSATKWPVVVEACEYQGHFHALRPTAAVVLNAEWDHPDSYADEAASVASFQQFVGRFAGSGPLVIDASLADRWSIASTVVRYSTAQQSGYWPRDVAPKGNGCQFHLMNGDRCVGAIEVPCLPLKQVGNAVAAAAVAIECGATFNSIAGNLREYRGVARRFDVLQLGETIFVDDYAHHPTAIRQTLSEIRLRWTERPVLAVLEPHQAGRLNAFSAGFADALGLADEVILAPVFAAREPETPIGALQPLANQLGEKAIVCDALDQVTDYVETRILKQPQTVIALMGAGKIGRILDGRRGQP